ncbi:hypothetical protein LP420_07010 [Massilia sp. B-10]|nr:hypothetical protein LP420_07010 [Massilia sp. B-10]
MDEDLLALVKAMRHAVDPALSPVENIKRVGHAYVTFGLRHPDQYALVFMERRPHAPVENSNVEHGNQAQDPCTFGVQLFVELAASGLVLLRRHRIDGPDFLGRHTRHDLAAPGLRRQGNVV